MPETHATRRAPTALVLGLVAAVIAAGTVAPASVAAAVPDASHQLAVVASPDGSLRVERQDPDDVRFVARDAIVATGPEVEYRIADDIGPSGDLRRGEQWALDRLDVETVWDRSTGARADGRGRIVVAVVDTGVDGDHPDLEGRVLPGGNFVGYDGEVAPNGTTRPVDDDVSDFVGHGTHVAGTIAAIAGNGVGIAGIAPGAEVLPVRVIGRTGSGTNLELASGIFWAVDQGADIINLSLGSVVDDLIVRAAVQHAADNGVLVLAAVGNCGGIPLPAACQTQPDATMYPAAWTETVGIGATDAAASNPWNDRLAPFSTEGSHVDLVAPGVDILATSPGGGYETMSGTSMATAVASGAAALVWAAHPADAASGMRERLARTAVDLGDDGRDPSFGDGLVDPSAALAIGARDPLRGVGPAALVEHLTSTACPAEMPVTGFPDVDPDATHGAAIDCARAWELTNGDAQGRYRPDQGVTRGQMASFLLRLVEGSSGRAPSVRGSVPDAFGDDGGSVHEDAINRLAAAGIVAGRDDGSYGAGARVTRGQMATFLVRTFEYRTTSELAPAIQPFDDVEGSVHADAIAASAEAGFSSGRVDGSFGPGAGVTRAQMASFLVRVIGRLVAGGHSAGW